MLEMDQASERKRRKKLEKKHLRRSAAALGDLTPRFISQDKGKGRADPQDEQGDDDGETDEVDLVWQLPDASRKWYMTATPTTRLKKMIKRLPKRIGLLPEMSDMRLMEVRLDGREREILDEYDFEAVKRRAKGSYEAGREVIIKVYPPNWASSSTPTMSNHDQNRAHGPLPVVVVGDPSKYDVFDGTAPPKLLPLTTSSSAQTIHSPHIHSTLPTPLFPLDSASKATNKKKRKRKEKKKLRHRPSDISIPPFSSPTVELDVTPLSAMPNKLKRPRVASPTGDADSKRMKESPAANRHLHIPNESGVERTPSGDSEDALGKAQNETTGAVQGENDPDGQVTADNASRASDHRVAPPSTNEYIPSAHPEVQPAVSEMNIAPEPTSPAVALTAPLSPEKIKKPRPSRAKKKLDAITQSAEPAASDIPDDSMITPTTAPAKVSHPVSGEPSFDSKRDVPPNSNGDPFILHTAISEPISTDRKHAGTSSLASASDSESRSILLSSAWNLFRKPRSPPKSPLYSSSSIDRPKALRSKLINASAAASELQAKVPDATVESPNPTETVPVESTTIDEVPKKRRRKTKNESSIAQHRNNRRARVAEEIREESIDVAEEMSREEASETDDILAVEDKEKLDETAEPAPGKEAVKRTTKGRKRQPKNTAASETAVNAEEDPPADEAVKKRHLAARETKSKDLMKLGGKAGSAQPVDASDLQTPDKPSGQPVVGVDSAQSVERPISEYDPMETGRKAQSSGKSRKRGELAKADSLDIRGSEHNAIHPDLIEDAAWARPSSSRSRSSSVDSHQILVEATLPPGPEPFIHGLPQLGIVDDEVDNLPVKAQQAKIANRAACLICGTSPVHLQKDCPKVKAGVEALEALSLIRHAELEQEELEHGKTKSGLKNGKKPSAAVQRTKQSIGLIEDWIERLRRIRQKAIGMNGEAVINRPHDHAETAEPGAQVNITPSTAPITTFHHAQDQEGETPPVSAVQLLRQKALSKPGSASGLSVSDAVIEAEDSASDSGSSVQNDDVQSPVSEHDVLDKRSDSSEGASSNTSDIESGTSSSPAADSASDDEDDADLSSFMRKPATKDQIRRARISAASIKEVRPPSDSSSPEVSPDESNESVGQVRGRPAPADDDSDIGGADESEEEERSSRSSSAPITNPPAVSLQIDDVPMSRQTSDNSEAFAQTVASADQSTRSSRSFVDQDQEAGTSPAVENFEGAKALRAVIEDERTPFTLSAPLPSTESPNAGRNGSTSTAMNDMTTATQSRGNTDQIATPKVKASNPSRPSRLSSTPLQPAIELLSNSSQPLISPPARSQRRLRSASGTTASPEIVKRKLTLVNGGHQDSPGPTKVSKSLSKAPTLSPEINIKRTPKAMSRELVVELEPMLKSTREALTNGSLRPQATTRKGSARLSSHLSERSQDGRTETNAAVDALEILQNASNGLQLNVDGDMSNALGVSQRTLRRDAAATESPKPKQKTPAPNGISGRDSTPSSPAPKAASRPMSRKAASQKTNASSAKAFSSQPNLVSDSARHSDSASETSKRSRGRKAVEQVTPIPKKEERSSQPDQGKSEDDDPASETSSDDETASPLPPIRPVHPRRAESQQLPDPTPSLSSLSKEILRLGRSRHHLHPETSSQPTPRSKKVYEPSDDSDEDTTSSEDEVVRQPMNGKRRYATGKASNPKSRTNGKMDGW